MKAFLSVKVLIILIFVFTIPDKIECQDLKTESKDEYNEIVFEIPSVIITRYEYEKNLNEFINNYTSGNIAGPSNEILNNWKKDFIDRMYLLAELNHEGFGNRQDVINTVNSMERIILTQDHGLVYDEFVTKNINVTDEDVKAAYGRSGKHITVEYLRFPNYDSLYSVVSGFKTNARIETKDDFKKLAAICKEYPQIKHDTLEFVWPYWGMENFDERIYNLNQDEIISPVEIPGGVFVFYAKAVYNSEKDPFDKIQSQIRKILEENQRKSFLNKFNGKISSSISFHINDVICDKFMKIYDIELFKDYEEPGRTEKLNTRFKDILKDTILTYSYGIINSLLTVENLLQYYSNGVILPIFKNKSSLINYVSDYSREEYILQLADSLGIKNRIKHKLDKNNYKNKTILGFYEGRDLWPVIEVTDSEIEKFYTDNQAEYQSGVAAEISVFTFDSERNANLGKMLLSRNINNMPLGNDKNSQFQGLKQLDSCITVTRNNGIYPNDIIRLVFILQDGQISQPIKLSNDFIVIKKNKETGSMVKPIEEVREEIIENIKRIKCNKIKNEKILTAKEKYQIMVNKIETL